MSSLLVQMPGREAGAASAVADRRAMTRERVGDVGVASMRAQPGCSLKPTLHGSGVVCTVRPSSRFRERDTTWVIPVISMRWHVELANVIFEYFEISDNRQRRHPAIGMHTPGRIQNHPPQPTRRTPESSELTPPNQGQTRASRKPGLVHIQQESPLCAPHDWSSSTVSSLMCFLYAWAYRQFSPMPCSIAGGIESRGTTRSLSTGHSVRSSGE